MEEALPLLWIALATLVFVAVFLRRITKHTPFSPILPTIVIRDPGVARRMLFDHADAFSNRPTTPFPLDFASVQGGKNYSIGNMPYGPLWRALRCSLTADVLHPTRLRLLEPLRREAVESLVARLAHHRAAAGEEVVVRDSLRAAAYALIARACFGDDGIDARDVHTIERAQMEFLVAYKGAMETQRSRLPRLVYWRQWLRFDAAFNRLAEVLVPLIAASRRRRRRRRQAQPGCGGGGRGCFVPFVDSLLNLRVHDGGEDRDDADNAGRMLKDTEMAPIVWELIAAGAESVVSCVEWTLAHLVSQPEVQNKLHRELAAAGVVHEEHLRSTPYLRAVILECLRMHPTVPLLIREVDAHAAATAAAAATPAPAPAVGGATVPSRGSTATRFTLLVSARHIGRNKKAWTDPDEFRPEHFLAGGEGEDVGPLPGSKEIKMVPFGAGRRYCPGAGMGMLHIGCFLAALVREFEWAPPAHEGQGGGGVDMTEVDMFFKLMRTPLRARFTPRSSA